MGYLEDNARTGREILPDLVRAFALIGIALVNVGTLSYPTEGYMYGNGLATPIDNLADMSVNALFTFKSYTLFSFMFGVGFAYQIASAQRRSAAFGAQYTRRIIGLMVLGLLHVALFYQGDILVMYAILGTFLFSFKDVSVKKLVIIAGGIYALKILVLLVVAIAIALGIDETPETLKAALAETAIMRENELAVFGNGSFVQTVILRLKDFAWILVGGLFIQGFGAFSFFLLGLAAVKTNIINDAAAPVWKWLRWIGLPIGLLGSLWGAWVMSKSVSLDDPTLMYGVLIIGVFAPFSTVGYLGLIAKWADGSVSMLKTFMARGGSATLTAYLMQGLILSLIFNGYGLGLYAKLGAAQCILIALVVAVFTVTFASLWRTTFYRGPMEMLLRGWTYLGAR